MALPERIAHFRQFHWSLGRLQHALSPLLHHRLILAVAVQDRDPSPFCSPIPHNLYSPPTRMNALEQEGSDVLIRTAAVVLPHEQVVAVEEMGDYQLKGAGCAEIPWVKVGLEMFQTVVANLVWKWRTNGRRSSTPRRMTSTLITRVFPSVFGTGCVRLPRLGRFNYPSQLSPSTTYPIGVGFEQSNESITRQDPYRPAHCNLDIGSDNPERIGEHEWEDSIDQGVECSYSKDRDEAPTEHRENLYMVKVREDAWSEVGYSLDQEVEARYVPCH